MAPPGNSDIDMDLSLFLAGPLGAAMCAKKIHGWFHDGKGPGQTTDTGHEAWGNVSSAQADVSELINKAVRDSGTSWGGTAGDSMRSSTSPLGSWADTAAASATSGSSNVAQLGDAFRTAQNSVQPPVEVPDKPWYNGAVPWDTDYDEALEKSSGVDSANMEALNAYAGQANSSMSSMPQFESPNSSTTAVEEKPPPAIDQTKQYDGYDGRTGTSSVTPSSYQPPTSTDGTTNPSWTPPNSNVSGGNNPGTTNPSWTSPTPVVPNPNPPGGGNSGTQPPGGSYPGVIPSGGMPKPGTLGTGGKPGTPGGPGGTPRGPGGAAATGRPGGGLGGAGKMPGFGPEGSARGVGPGGSSGLLGSAEQGRGARGAGAAGGRGAAGAGAMGGMAGGAGRGEGGEDEEHTTKYLIPTDEHFGDGTMVVPPVIGE